MNKRKMWLASFGAISLAVAMPAGAAGPGTMSAPAIVTPQAQAALLAQLDARRAARGQDARHGYAILRRHPGTAGTQVARVAHTFEGVPIFGVDAVLVLDANGKIVSESDAARRANAVGLDAGPGADFSVVPTISSKAAIDAALAALAASHGRPVMGMAGLALARAAEAPRATQIAESLEREFPGDTLVQRYWVPCIRGALALARGDATACVQALEKAAAGEMGQVPPFELGMLYPPYLRGAAYLRAARPDDAAREFRKILARPGIAMNFVTFPLAQLGLARALALGGAQEEAAAEYDRFLDLWRGADGEVAVLKEAIAERDRVR